MKNQFTIDNPMPPIWIMYPYITQYSIGWRMGAGEGYKYALYDWLKTLTAQEQKLYDEMFPRPIFWRKLSSEEFGEEVYENYSYELIPFWQKNGKPKYSISQLLTAQHTQDLAYIFFWKPNPNTIDPSCLGQWQPAPFMVDIDDYTCAEQYMMAEKARLFEDDAIEKLIMQTADPKEMKALGKKVKNFDQTVWDKVKYSIVLNANYYKFTQNKEMRNFLLSTGNKILVEASPLDPIWGIGLGAEDPKAHNPTTWKGKNLLGFALMEVRDELRKLYKNYDKIDWKDLDHQH